MGSYSPPATPPDPVDVEAQIVALLQSYGYLLTTDGQNVLPIASEFGNGSNFLRMSAEGYPVWADVATLVEYISGGLNRWCGGELSQVLPLLCYEALDNTEDGATADNGIPVPMAGIQLCQAIIV